MILHAKAEIRFVTHDGHLYCEGKDWAFALCKVQVGMGCDLTYGPGSVDAYCIKNTLFAKWTPSQLSALSEDGFPSRHTTWSLLAHLTHGQTFDIFQVVVMP